MPRLNTELFIAKRISSRTEGRKNVMIRIATITVAIGMAVMIVALAVVGGFKKEVTGKLVGFSSHVRIVNLYTNNSFETSPVTVDSALMRAISEIPGFKSISTYALKGGIIKTPGAIQGIALKGTGPDHDNTFLTGSLLRGNLPQVSDSVRHKDLLVSESVARMLKVDVGDRVEMLFISTSRPVRRDRFKICGLYSTGMEELDRTMAFTDIRNVQRLNGWSGEQVSGYEVMTADFDKLTRFSNDVYNTVFDNSESISEVLKVEDIVNLNPGIFDWLKAHNMNAAVIIIIMLLVALLNMISAMLIILLEKTSMIGILKALGMNNWSVQKIFLLRALRIVLYGMLWGNAIGIGICLLQKYTGFVKLDSSGYFLSQVPIEISWEWLVGLNIAVPIVMVLLLSIPALVVSSVKPEKTIRFQ